MAFNDLANNQAVTYENALTGGFTLKPSQTNSGTNECMVKLDANTTYHLVQSNLTSFLDNQLVTKESMVPRPVAWRGINPSCLVEGDTALSAFDFLVIKYKWTLGAGQDLDTFTGIINTGTSLDNNWVGYAQGQQSVPDSTSVGNAYIYWGGDNVDTNGAESILVNFSKITTDFPSLSTIITKMNATWYSVIDSGNIEMEIKTYLGGTMSSNGLDIVNTGGTNVQNLFFSKRISSNSSSGSIQDSDEVGFVIFTKSSTTGQITITY